MKKKMNNKGFSLVELIVVITILGVLVGIAIPQFLGYVKRTKISTDIKNAQELASVIMAEIAEEGNSDVKTLEATTAKPITQNMLNSKMTLPTAKVDSTYSFTATYDKAASKLVILLNNKEVYPDATAYKTAENY